MLLPSLAPSVPRLLKKMTLTAHARALILFAWLTALSWSLPAAAQALAPSLSDGLKAYDFESLLWSVLVSTVGGFGRTALTLLSPNVVVLDVLKETWKDLLIAALAGMVADVILQAMQSVGVNLPVPLVVLILAACGWARMSLFLWAESSAKTLSERGTQWAADKISKPANTSSKQPNLEQNARETHAAALRVDNPDGGGTS